MKYEMTEDRWDSITRFFDRVFDNPEEVYDDAVILSLSNKEMKKMFTKKRLELIKVIKKKNPKTMSKLAKIVKRKLSAVNRDLEILEGLGIVKLEKSGKEVKPVIEKKVLIVPLISLEPQTIEEYEKGLKVR